MNTFLFVVAFAVIGAIIGAVGGGAWWLAGVLVGATAGALLAKLFPDAGTNYVAMQGQAARETQRQNRAATHADLSLEQKIENELRRGGRLESRTATTAVIIPGRRVSHLLHFFIGLFTLGLWWIAWLLLAIFGGERRIMLGDRRTPAPRRSGTATRRRYAPMVTEHVAGETSSFCTECGSLLSKDTKFCGQCGEAAPPTP